MEAHFSVPLHCGRTALIDAADYRRTFYYTARNGKTYPFRICDLSWHSDCGGGKHRRKTNYARSSVRRDGIKFSFRMHTLIMGKVEGWVIDHEDMNGLNNTRQNLRYKTNAENVRLGHLAAKAS